MNNVNLRNIFFWGNRDFNGVGIEFAGTTTNEAVIENVSDSFFQNDNEGVLIGRYVQGVTIRGSNFSGNHAIYSPNGSYQLTISDNQFVTTDHDIDITGENSAVSVIANLFFIPSSKCGLYINSGSSYEITGNNFQPVASATSTTGVVFRSATRRAAMSSPEFLWRDQRDAPHKWERARLAQQQLERAVQRIHEHDHRQHEHRDEQHHRRRLAMMTAGAAR